MVLNSTNILTSGLWIHTTFTIHKYQYQYYNSWLWDEYLGKKLLEKNRNGINAPVQEYIRSIRCWYRSWIVLRFSLNAAVTRPKSGVHTSDTNLTACGISNFSKRRLAACFFISSSINFSTFGLVIASSKLVHSIESTIYKS